MEWIVVLSAIVLGIPTIAWLAQDRLVYFPQPVASTTHLSPRTIALEVVAADGARLRGWMRPAAAVPAPLVLYFGGNAEEVSWTLADARWPPDWSVAAINYRGYGASEGKPSEVALSGDALVIHDALAARPDVNAARIVAFGRSLGTSLAAKLAAARPIAGVILISPFDSMVEIGRTHYPWLPVSWLLRHRYDAIADARAARAPLLTIVAADDTIIPPRRSRALFDAWAGPKAWLALTGRHHNDVGDDRAAWDAIAGFLAARARSSSAP